MFSEKKKKSKVYKTKLTDRGRVSGGLEGKVQGISDPAAPPPSSGTVGTLTALTLRLSPRQMQRRSRRAQWARRLSDVFRRIRRPRQ